MSSLEGNDDDDISLGSSYEIVSDPDEKVAAFSLEGTSMDGGEESSFSSSSSSSDMVLVEGSRTFLEEASASGERIVAFSSDRADETNTQEAAGRCHHGAAPWSEIFHTTSEYEYESDYQSDVGSTSSYSIPTSIVRRVDELHLLPPECQLHVSKMKDMNLKDDGGRCAPSMEGDVAASITTQSSLVRTTLSSSRQGLTDDAFNDTEEPSGVEVPHDPAVSRTWGSAGGTPSALSLCFEPPHELMYCGDFTGALNEATKQRKLLLVSIQDYSQFSSHLVNRDILRNDLIREVIGPEFVLWQTTVGTQVGRSYVSHYRVGMTPHLGVIHPAHKSIIWGLDGWTAEKPWSVREIVQPLTEICFDRFDKEQRSMEVDFEEAFDDLSDQPVDVSEECALQDALGLDDNHSADEIMFRLEFQVALLQSQPRGGLDVQSADQAILAQELETTMLLS